MKLPHELQKRSPGAGWVPQDGQGAVLIDAPHDEQKLPVA